MDQDSFRQLLQTPHAGSSTGAQTTSRGSFLASTSKTKSKTIDASQPAFKPRKVKKNDSQYRDRAAERRVGEGNDFAEVEAVLEDFKKRTTDEDKDALEEQRRYLGGDKDHSILVKGLDIALLEQNKARAAQTTGVDDDDSLEQAFQEVTTESSVPKKRTREDIIKELKEKRQQGGVEDVAKDEAVLLEEAKKAGKFKPIGFKPIGAPAEAKKKKKKTGEIEKDGGRKKKKRKVDAGNLDTREEEMPPPSIPVDISPPKPTVSEPEPEPEPIPEDFDIFAGAEVYEGVDLGDDDEEEEGQMQETPIPEQHQESVPRAQWFTDDVPGEDRKPQQPDLTQLNKTVSNSHSPPAQSAMDEDDEETGHPTRLVPLSSSAIPSIKELLAMDGAQDKKKKWKDKKKGPGGKEVDPEDQKKATAEAKAERDYKRLKTYTEKKKAGAPATKGS